MSSKEYHDGKLMESNTILHSHLKKALQFDTIEVRGETTTKGDIVGYRNKVAVPVSIKHGSQKNTQVHLPTLRSFSRVMNIPSNVESMLEKWLGVTEQEKFTSWFSNTTPVAQNKKYKRLFANDIADWEHVVLWFNENNNKIAKLLIQAMNDEQPAEYLVWVYKKKNTFQVISIPALIDWITTDCKWVTGARNNGSTLRCENAEGKPIFHMQMKGSGGTGNEYNHNPQFHIHINWPESVIVYQNTLA